MNDIDKAKEFENTVAELLRLAGYEVSTERILGHKKVDLYFEERRLGSIRRIAVECKRYAANLTQADLTKIYMNYRPLYESNLIDEVLVVTLKGLAPSAETMVRETREMSHLTSSDLQSLVMDFSSYLLGQLQQFHEQGLSSYYVRPRTSDEADLEEVVMRWVGGDSDQPIAILGSYGIGKTTFARRLAHVLADRALNDSDQRIPIFIRLGEISSEQSLEGLLGKIFTATSVVRSYTFDVFMALNQLGRFVIILDGFDEMKHTLSWEEFRFNFRQLNRLVTKNSKVILLGRPTAFLNDQEHRHALHGIRLLNGLELREPDWPDYREVYLASFGRKQVEEFLEKYLDYRKSVAESPGEKQELEHIKQTQIDRISSKRFADMARRPVQLKMLSDVLPQWKGDIDNLTVALLYSFFIDLIIERDQEKIARRRFNVKQRREFARKLAVWLWRSKREMSVTAGGIPEAILSEFARSSDDIEAVRRDLVSACFLERKLGESLYFPHRSFQEFLVAEAIIDDFMSRRISIREADALLNEEVASFMEGLINVSVLRASQDALAKHRGTLSLKFARIWSAEPQYKDHLLGRLENTNVPWYPLLLTVAVRRHRFDSISAKSLCAVLFAQMNKGDALYALVCYLCIAGLAHDPRIVGASLVNLTGVELFAEEVVEEKTRTGKKKKKTILRPDPLIVELFGKIGFTRKQDGVELGGIYPVLCKALRDYCLISDWIVGSTIKTDDISLPRKLFLDSESLDKIREFQRTYRWRPRQQQST